MAGLVSPFQPVGQEFFIGSELPHWCKDVSVHPFTGGAGPGDVRITTRYSTKSPFEGIMGTIHETGHALYEQGRNERFLGLPVSEALSMGVHESQSLFWERMIGQTQEFWDAMLPKLHSKLPHTQTVSGADIFQAINRVSASLIRVDADEVTYPMHIMVRFEIERGLFDGSIKVEEVPKVWAQKFQDLLGIEIPDDSQGCLQDIHWPSGAFGYFPSYTLGAMMAAQLFAHLDSTAMPDIRARIRKGDFQSIKSWLNENIHAKGSLHTSLDDLLKNVTGEPLNPKYFLLYLQNKYRQRYQLTHA